MSRYILLFHTVKFLKPIQIYYRGFYFIRARFRKLVRFRYSFFKKANSNRLKLEKSIESKSTYSQGEFKFLNLSKEFKGSIDWNYSGYGKLWTYNLNYFDFLSKREEIYLIEDFIKNIDSIKDGLEPYPISLRTLNWVKFLSYNSIKSEKIDNSLYAQYYILLDNLEYHLLGNHLLENGFSLLFGAYYFQDDILYLKAKEILLKQLDEQILDDGGHFELSPMYHQIVLFRVLDSINLVKHNSWQSNKKFLEFLIYKAEIMLGWLSAVSYRDGSIPMFNDSAKDIAPTTNELIEYSKRLNLGIRYLKLSDSGYRKISNSSYECIVDIGDIKANYIAGHTHADIFNFELKINNRPFIVDMGIITYNDSKKREFQRSTSAHNTVEIKGKNQSEVWSSFRVGDRGRVIDIKESKNIIEATHNGYKNTLHTRIWIFNKDRVTIKDSLGKNSIATARLYFHYSISKQYILEHIKIYNSSWKLFKYDLSIGFNSTKISYYIEIYFNKTSKIDIFII